VIFAKHPPLTIGLPAVALSKLWRAPMIYRIVDMWPETLQATGMVSSTRALDLINDLGRFVYRHASEISVISPGFRTNLIQKGVPPQKIQVVPDWVDSDLYYPAEPDPVQAQELGLAGRFNVMFAGNIGAAQGLDTVLEAAVLTQQVENLQYVFVGDGVDLQRLQDLARERNIANVRFLGRYPVAAMSGLYAHADVLLVHLRDDSLFRITIPHKIYAYLASGKPILVAVRGDASDVVAEAGAGMACNPEDAQALAAAVCEFVAMPREKRDEMAAAGLRAARERYSRLQSIRKFEQRMIDLAQPS
jgi:glycosyltransferase involved in cell wall biosynthesis